MTTIRDMIATGDQNNNSFFEQNTKSNCPRDPFARHIAKRIKEVEETAQVSAPDVFGEESFPDVNIVAEYIDRTLNEAPLIREYEDASLNDSVLLAELVDCAQWSDALTAGLTIGVPEHCRHRLYYAQNKHNPTEHEDNSVLISDIVNEEPVRHEEHDTPPKPERTPILETSPVVSERLEDSVSSESANNIPRPSSKRFDGKKVVRNFYRIMVMAALIGIVVLFLRLPPDERQENLSRLRNIWTLFQSDKVASGEAVSYPNLPANKALDSRLDSKQNDTLSDGKPDSHGDFPLPSTPISMNQSPKEPRSEGEGIATSLPPVEELSLQPSFVIPGGGDLLQSSPEILR